MISLDREKGSASLNTHRSASWDLFQTEGRGRVYNEEQLGPTGDPSSLAFY